ncbi:hypothetical protein GUITHDRAFT_99583 [Guillardia theta CCMP2712]|uniref:Uncharacterized protein n=1 Tax=Guillardia theta (strain CCMP2712) TaxID=905079 RepID=L1K2X2_GUITC|nr:hypothetical protein GUITHDRAFT_99583 [Guillardia theta CCMP2712]EKX54932.1 hypothetical protein GUITHDRAFT_99583 [Guillardia theta CCMP2712]|eukprot:XP_005841912.1 hypothetical protein GUITHDRAFT_99583 [Guillardia theta CCMP2712]
MLADRWKGLRLLCFILLWQVMPGALTSVGNNGMDGGERVMFVSKITKLVRRGPRMFAVLDEDKYLPLSHPQECPRPPGLQFEEGQWLKIEARRNMDASKNPWTCTRVISAVSPPSMTPQYIDRPWQGMNNPTGMLPPHAEPAQNAYQHGKNVFQQDVGGADVGWNEGQPLGMMQQRPHGYPAPGSVPQYVAQDNYAPRADMPSFVPSPGKRPASSLNPGFHSGARMPMGLRGSMQYGEGSLQPVKMHRGKSWDSGGYRQPTEEMLAEDIKTCRKYMDLIRCLDSYFASSPISDLSSGMASQIIYKISCLLVADHNTIDKNIHHHNTQSLMSALLERLRSDTLSLSCGSICSVTWAMGKIWLTKLKKGAYELQESIKKAMEVLATEMVARDLNTLTSQQLSMAIFGIAKSGLTSPRFASVFEKCEKVICEGGVSNYSNQNLANMVWAFAFYGYQSNAVMTHIDDELSRRNISALKPAELSMTLWACARYHHPSKWLYTRFSSEMRQRGFSNCSTQELANLCWALTESSDEYGDLVYDVAQEVSSRPVNPRNSKDMRNILCCIAKSRVPDCGLASEVARELEASGSTTSVRAWILTFWAFSHIAFIPSSDLQQSFETKVQGDAISNSTTFLCKALLSFVKLPLNQPRLTDRLLDLINSTMPNQTGISASNQPLSSARNLPTVEDLAELLWCCAYLRRLEMAPQVLQNLLQLMSAQKMQGTSSRHLLMLVWSTGVMQEEGFELDAMGENISLSLNEHRLLLGERILSLSSRDSLLRLLAVLLPCTEQSKSVMLQEHPAMSRLWTSLSESWAEDEDKLKRLQSLLGYA